jgi:hypothetical protein
MTLRLLSFKGALATSLAIFCVLSPVVAQDDATVSLQMRPTPRDPTMVITIDPQFTIGAIEAARSMEPGAVAALAQKAMAAEDSDPTVTIWLPLLAYGSAGSFNEIRIASDGGVSIDPGVLVSEHREQYTGSVTIEIFDEFELWGSYHAELYTVADPPESVGGIEGDFHIALPIVSDPRAEAVIPKREHARSNASAIWDGLAVAGLGLDGLYDTDAISALRSPSGASANIPDRSSAPAVPSPPQSGGVGRDQSCVCLCAVLLTLPEDSQCRAECRANGVLCGSDLVAMPDISLKALVEYMITTGGMPEAMRAQMMQQYAGLSAEDRKQMFMNLQVMSGSIRQ